MLKRSSRKPLKLKDCPDCGKQFLHENSLRQHRRVHMKIKLLSDPNADERKPPISMPEINKKPPESMPQIVLICELCNYIFTSKEDLRDHKFIKHGESMPNFLTTTTQAPNDLIDEQEMMRRQFLKKCDYCSIQFRCPTIYFDHIESHIKQKKEIALKGAKSQQNLQKKRKKVSNISNDYHTCRVCFKVLDSKSAWRAHLKARHGQQRKLCQPIDQQTKGSKRNQKPTTKVAEVPKEKLHCGFCQSICSNAERLKSHMELKHKDKVHQKIFYCKPCKKYFLRIDSLRCHQFWKHRDDSSISISETKSLNNSKKTAKEAKNARQNVEKKVTVKQEPQRQSVRNKKDKNNPSKETEKLKDEKELVKEKEIAKNKQQQINETKFMCPTCDAECPNETALQVHLLEKHEQQVVKEKEKIVRNIPYRCNICNLIFTVQSSYEDHRRFHALVEQPKRCTYACNHCTAAFNKLESLKLHLENFHTKLQCHHCDKEFETPASLNIHIAVAHRKQKGVAAAAATTTSTHFEHYHSQLQPQLFKCQECDSVFEKVGSLNIHLVVVHEKQNMITDENKTAVAVPTLVKRFACTICGLGFNDTKQLEVHVQDHSFRSQYQ